MGQDNTVPRRINRVEGAAGQVILSGGPEVVETWGAPAPAVHGAELHTDITREIFLPANEGFVEAGTPSYYGITGGANADEPTVWLWMKVPVDFVSFTKVEAIWLSSAVAGNMYWELYAYYGACGENVSNHSDEPGRGVTATGGGDIRNCQEPANALALASLALGDYIALCFSRIGTHASDTLNDTMHLEGLLFTYVANQ